MHSTTGTKVSIRCITPHCQRQSRCSVDLRQDPNICTVAPSIESCITETSENIICVLRDAIMTGVKSGFTTADPSFHFLSVSI